MSPVLAEIEQVAERLVPVEEVRLFADLLYTLDVDELKDEDFEFIERLIDRAVRLLSESANASHRELIGRLLVAREGIEQGISPNPDRRPSLEEMRRYVADRL